MSSVCLSRVCYSTPLWLILTLTLTPSLEKHHYSSKITGDILTKLKNINPIPVHEGRGLRNIFCYNSRESDKNATKWFDNSLIGIELRGTLKSIWSLIWILTFKVVEYHYSLILTPYERGSCFIPAKSLSIHANFISLVEWTRKTSHRNCAI